VKRFVVLSLLTGCSWASFDSLAGSTWVDSAGPPKGADTTKYGANLVAGGAAPTNGGMNVLVLGRTNPDVSRLSYDANGVVSQGDAGDVLTALQFLKFDDLHPAVAGDPASSMVAFTMVTRDGAVGGDKDANTKWVFYDTATTGSDGPKYITQHEGPVKSKDISSGIVFSAAGENLDPASKPDLSDLVISRGPDIMIMADWALPEGSVNGNPSTYKLYACHHKEPTAFGVALGEFDSTHSGREILLATGPLEGSTGPSKIKGIAPESVVGHDAAAIGDCFTSDTVLFEIDKTASGIKDLGKQLLVTTIKDTGGNTISAIVASAPASNKLFVFTGEHGTNEIDVPTPDGAGDFGTSLAVGDLDGDGVDELAVGGPKSTADGVTDAGSVFVFKWNATTMNYDLAATLHDASPDIEQHFGQSVAIVPFGSAGKHVLVTGSDNEVFTYFRLSPLYADVRAGRAAQ